MAALTSDAQAQVSRFHGLRSGAVPTETGWVVVVSPRPLWNGTDEALVTDNEWQGVDEAADQGLEDETSSAQGLLTQAARVGAVAVLLRWSVKTVHVVERAVEGALDALGAVGRDLSATTQVLLDRATTEMAVIIEQAGSLSRVLLILLFVFLVWGLAHKAWNHFMHALKGNTSCDAEGNPNGPKGDGLPAGRPSLPPSLSSPAVGLTQLRNEPRSAVGIRVAARTAEVRRLLAPPRVAVPPKSGQPAQLMPGNLRASPEDPASPYGEPLSGLGPAMIAVRSASWSAGMKLFQARFASIASWQSSTASMLHSRVPIWSAISWFNLWSSRRTMSVYYIQVGGKWSR